MMKTLASAAGSIRAVPEKAEPIGEVSGEDR